MKRGFLILFALTLSLLDFAQKIEFNGNYQGNNLYIQNPLAGSSNGYCTEKILVNGIPIRLTNDNSYVIHLDSLQLHFGDSVKVEIFHKLGCIPKLLGGNSSTKYPFKIESISIDSFAVLHWVAKSFSIFNIEQYKWNKWVKVGEVYRKDSVKNNEFKFQTNPHSGKNIFRITQVEDVMYFHYQTAEYLNSDLKIKILKNKNRLSDELEFNKETMYELYNKEGYIIREGKGKKIDLRQLGSDCYYLNYDNKMTEIKKIR